MAIAALSAGSFNHYIQASSGVSASQQALQALQQGLASGNLGAAQTAFNAYQALNQTSAGSSTSGSSSSSSSSSGTSQLATDLTTLGTALSSGDLSTAQSAFATVQSDLKATPSTAVVNAEAAAAQTVQWIDDLFSPATSDSSSSTTDPTTSILDGAFGINPSSLTLAPGIAQLEAQDGSSGTAAGGTAGSIAASATGSDPSLSSVSLYA
jgi:hypothetical protein